MDDLKRQIEGLPEERQVALLLRRLERSERARQDAEVLLESRARELDRINKELLRREEDLRDQLDLNTRQLLAAQRTANIATLFRERGGEFVFSPEFARLIGAKPDELIDAPSLLECIHPLDRDRVAKMESHFYTEHPPGVDHHYEHRLIRKSDQELRWLRWTLRREIDESGRLGSVLGTVQDITESRQADRRVKALRLLAERRVRILSQLTEDLEGATRSEQQISSFLQAIMDAVPQGIAVFDSHLKLAAWNAQLVNLTEIDGAKLVVGMPFESPPDVGVGRTREIKRNDDGNVLDETYERELTDGRIVQVDVIGRTDGSMVRIYSDVTRFKLVEADLRSQGVELSGRVDDLVQLSRELRKSKAEAEKANRYKSRFLAMMSHDIRTPMNGILGMLEVLQASDLDDDQSRQLGLARDSGKQLSTLLNDIIEIVRAESGKMQLHTEAIDLHQTVSGIFEFWRTANVAQGVKLSCEIDKSLPRQVMLDPTRFRQLIDNLLSNALKYSSQGQITLRAKRADDVLRIEVQDDGPGISNDQQDKLFMDFTRVPGNAANSGESAGLGLAICRRIVSAMDGEIGVESDAGKGSTFWFELPFVSANEATSAAQSSSVDEADFGILKGATVLVAEDLPTNREVLRAMLQPWGCELVMAHDGAEALDIAAAGNVDIALMDVNMPRMDGVDATQAIRALSSEIADVPIIGVTAHVMEDEQQRLLAAGMNALVPKPIDREILGATMVQLLLAQNRPELQPDCELFEETTIETLLASLPAASGKTILQHALTDIEQLTADFAEAATCSDDDAIGRAAHSLKGVAGNIGAVRLAGLVSDASNLDLDRIMQAAADTTQDIRRRCDDLEV